MKDFAKLFSVNKQQVLITKEYDEEDESYKVQQVADFNGVRISIGLGFDKEKKRDSCFKDYSEENASKFIQMCEGFIKDNPPQ